MKVFEKMKSFEDLIKEVHEKGTCQQCGGCISFCNSIEEKVIGYKDPNSPPVYLNKDKCLECGICYLICPQTHVLEEEVNKTYKFSNFDFMPLGYIDYIYSCQATDKDFLKYGTDGGVVNSIINFLLQKNMIDGTIVAKTINPFSREAIIARTKEDLIDASGVKLDISPQLDEVQRFHTYTSSLPKLSHYRFKRLAVVGTPCQIYTIRCMQNLGIIPSENIELCLGLFCYENFYFDETKLRKFENDFNVKFEEIEKLNIKEDLILKLKNEQRGKKTIHIPFNRLNDYMRPACNACNDFTNIYADISFGGLGSPDKYTTVIPRSKRGIKIVSNALRAGVIKHLDLNFTRRRQMENLITQFSISKVKRKKEFLKKNLNDMEKIAPNSKTNNKKVINSIT